MKKSARVLCSFQPPTRNAPLLHDDHDDAYPSCTTRRHSASALRCLCVLLLLMTCSHVHDSKLLSVCVCVCITRHAYDARTHQTHTTHTHTHKIHHSVAVQWTHAVTDVSWHPIGCSLRQSFHCKLRSVPGCVALCVCVCVRVHINEQERARMY